MYLVWILRDFAIDKYKGGGTPRACSPTPTSRRTPSTSTSPSCARTTPVVHITSKTYFLRRGRADNGIKAYSNAPALDLDPERGAARARGATARYQHAQRPRGIDNVFFWAAPLRARPERGARRATARATPTAPSSTTRRGRAAPASDRAWCATCARATRAARPGSSTRPRAGAVAVLLRVRRHRRQHLRRPSRRRVRGARLDRHRAG